MGRQKGMTINVKGNTGGPNLEALGLKSPMEVIDILGALDLGGTLVITDDKAFLNPQLKAQQVMTFFKENFNLKPSDLPQLASIVKQDLKAGKLKFGGIA